jgi:tetraacyldisaccharide 4'-kinase
MVVGSTWFPDHHDYSRDDVASVIAAAQRAGAVVVTTGKDMVKLPVDADIWVVEAEMEPIEGSWRGLWRLVPGLVA